MKIAGITDSLASVASAPAVCARCHSAARIDRGECLSCLLAVGMETDEDIGGESFDAVLAEIDVRDSEWRLGNYEILQEVGRGGMGVIYRARQRHSRRIVALKRVLRYHSDSRETLERFRREAEAASSLDHPNILPIYEVGEADGLPFFTMKYATGGTLQQAGPALRKDPRECVRLLAKVTRAVAYGHSKGILHRDLKPANILLDGNEEPMVSDFGLAKWIDTDSDLTRSLAIFGTPGFIAPEQARGACESLTGAADVYSLGAILFDLLAGRPPFLGEHALAVIHQAAERSAPQLRSLVPGIDRDLETICAKCLEREPHARYRSADELATDLERWLDGRPITARPVSLPAQAWRWCKRNPSVAAALAISLLLAVGLGFSQVQKQSAERSAIAAAHAFVVDSPLDLDTAEHDFTFGNALARQLQLACETIGPARVLPPPQSGTIFIGADHNALSGKLSTLGARAVLRATTSSKNGQRRITFTLIGGNDGKPVYRRNIDLDTPNADPAAVARIVATDLYRTLDAPRLIGAEAAAADPGWQDEGTRELIVAGKAVSDRRSSADRARAFQLFQQAVERQPQSSLAHAHLADALVGRGYLNGDADALAAAETEAQTALRLAPETAKPHATLALVRFSQGRFQEALAETMTALHLTECDDPRLGMSMAENMRIVGQPARAAAWYRHIVGKEDRPGWAEFLVGDCLADLAADEEAAAAYKRAASLFPELPEGWMGLCRLALLRKDFATAQQIAAENWQHYRDFVFSQDMAAQVQFFARNFAEAEKLYSELAARQPHGGGSFYGAVSYDSALGWLRIAAGDIENGRLILRAALDQEQANAKASAEHPETHYRLAAIHASLGETAAALRELETAVQAGWVDYRSAELDPRFDSIREEPEFQRSIAQMQQRVSEQRTQFRASSAPRGQES